MNVMSLFDGISCGQIALKRTGIKVDKYFASEIDKHAIKVTQKNFPETVQLGDVTEIFWSEKDYGEIDLLMGGSPCQGFSFAGKRLNFEDARSKLFFEFHRILQETKPKYFLLENVKMKKESEQIITDYLGVEPIEINSSLVSAQNRVRLYWTNIPNVCKPKDKGISLEDILESKEFINPAAIRGRRLEKGAPISQCLEVRKTNIDKSNCLTTVSKDNVLTSMSPGRYPDAFISGLPFRYYTTREYCRLQTVDVNYFDDTTSENQVRKMLGNGWTVDVIAHILSGIKEERE